MQTYWIRRVNNLDSMERWAFVEFTRVLEIEAEFKDLVDSLTSDNEIFLKTIIPSRKLKKKYLGY